MTNATHDPSSTRSSLPRSPDAARLLGIYLEDHRAGAASGAALARRFLASNEGTELGDTIAVLSTEIDDDVATLDSIISGLGYTPSRTKILLGRGAELVGRLKSNGRLRHYSPLSRMEEFEALSAGIFAKASLWRTLSRCGVSTPPGVDLAELEARADRQRERLEAHRDSIVDAAFVTRRS